MGKYLKAKEGIPELYGLLFKTWESARNTRKGISIEKKKKFDEGERGRP